MSENERVAEWYRRHGAGVVSEVRRLLRASTRVRAGVSTSDVVASVWASVMDGHLPEIDRGDENGAWAVLARAARRHCEKWNRRATRHPHLSLDAMLRDDDQSGGVDLADERQVLPEVVVMANECAELFRLLGEGDAESVGSLVLPRAEEVIGLVRRLRDREREVLGLRLAGRKRQEIAQRLGVENHVVDEHWKSVRAKAEVAETAPAD
jgi:DNA-binding CsgD family transcriptional regulator